MHKRQFIYIALAALVLFFLSRQLQEPARIEPELLSRQTIMQQFESEADVSVAFPHKYRGDNGDAFYVILEKSGQTVTDYYEIYKDNDKNKLQYRIKDHWENIRLPHSRFEVYKLEQGKWQLLSE
ncbi:MAG: hypothetical protein PHD40_07720 [Syntrophomonadaceae bacterium]|nr:hypothetical protein [Syntrophomonadaceae bacterium]